MGDEIWKPIPGYEGYYEASSFGNVRSVDRVTPQADYLRPFKGRVLRPATRNDGYRYVQLTKKDHRRTMLVHRAVCLAFFGEQPDWAECIRHLDGDRSNNAVANLAFGTHSQNAFDTVQHGNNWQTAKTHCPQGHPYSEENLRIDRKATKDGRARVSRGCRTCHNESSRRRRVRKPRPVITHCPKGHEYTPENTYIQNGSRSCRKCGYERHKMWRKAWREKNPPPPRGPKPETVAEVVALYRQGESLNEIGERLGVSAPCVKNWLKRAGVPLRTLSEAQAMARAKRAA